MRTIKILKYVKLKNNQYQVNLENESIILDDEIIIKHELLQKKKIENTQLEELKKEQNNLKGYHFALKYLNFKMRTKKEIREYLKQKEIPNALISNILVRLEKEKYINDSHYANCYIKDSLKFLKDGPNKIKMKLKNLGIEENVIDVYLTKIDEDIWLCKIKDIIQKKYQANHSYSMQKFKNKITMYLFQNGYPYDIIYPTLDSLELEQDSSIIEECKEKLRKKLSRKYDGSSLEYQIKMKLYQAGFSWEEINALENEN